MPTATGDVTRLLAAAGGGDRAAFDKKYVFLKAGENGKLELQPLETFAP